MWTYLTSCSYFYDNSTGVKQQKSLKISNKNMSITNKTSHSDDNQNDLPNKEKTCVKTCKNSVKIVVKHRDSRI